MILGLAFHALMWGKSMLIHVVSYDSGFKNA